MSLTDAQIRKTVLPKDGRCALGDGRVPGLMLRMTGKGAKTWSLLFRVRGEGGKSPNGLPRRGQQYRMSIGHYPHVSLADARRLATEILNKADAGENPLRGARAETAITINDLIARYCTEGTKGLRKAEAIEQVLKVHLAPRWGKRLATSIEQDDARVLLREVLQPDAKTRRGGPGASAAVRTYGSRMFNWAREESILKANPFERVKAIVRIAARERILSAQELKALWQATGKMAYPYGPMYRLLILTGQRLREIASARWSWIDAESRTLEVPAAFFKGGRPHIVPLCDEAWSILQSLPRWTKGDFIFTTTSGLRPVNGFSKGKELLDRGLVAELKAAGVAAKDVEPWVVHDIRRTVRSGLSRLGVDVITAELVIGHKLKGIVGVYDRYERLSERRQALSQWASAMIPNVGQCEAHQNQGNF
jgi:integrase